MDGFQAYGAGKAGGAFDPLTFIKQPQTIIRILCWVSLMMMSAERGAESPGDSFRCELRWLVELRLGPHL